MSIITSPLEDFVEVGGVRYKIKTDFRNWIRIGQIMSDRNLEVTQKIVEALKNCYFRDSLPPTMEEAVRAMIRFYAGKDVTKKEKPEEKSRKQEPIYDFEHDAEYITAAFYAQYKIDLTEDEMHWHKFKALFMGLGEDNKICKIMEYRGIDLSKIKNKEQKRFYREMKQAYRLPDMRTEEEKERDMINSLSDAFGF